MQSMFLLNTHLELRKGESDNRAALGFSEVLMEGRMRQPAVYNNWLNLSADEMWGLRHLVPMRQLLQGFF